MNGRDFDLDDLFDRDADSRLLERRRREELGLAPQPPPASSTPVHFGAESMVHDTHLLPPRSAMLRVAVIARPNRELIPGAIVTVVVSLHDDGDADAADARVRVVLPAEVEAIPGSFSLDEVELDAEELLGTGLRVGTVGAGGELRIRFALRVLPGTRPLDLSVHAAAPGVPTISAPALRLTRRSGHAAFERPRPFFELEAGETDDALSALAATPPEPERAVDAYVDEPAAPEPVTISSDFDREPAADIKPLLLRRRPTRTRPKLIPTPPPPPPPAPTPKSPSSPAASSKPKAKPKPAPPPPPEPSPEPKPKPTSKVARIPDRRLVPKPETPPEPAVRPRPEAARKPAAATEPKAAADPPAAPVAEAQEFTLLRTIDADEVRALERVFAGGVPHGLAGLALLSSIAAVDAPVGGSLGVRDFAHSVAAALPRALVAARMQRATPPVVTRQALATIRPYAVAPAGHVGSEGPLLSLRLDERGLEALRAVLGRDLEDIFLRGVQVLLAVCPRSLEGVSLEAAERTGEALATYRVAAGAWLMRVTVRRAVDRAYDPLTADDRLLHDAGGALVATLRAALTT